MQKGLLEKTPAIKRLLHPEIGWLEGAENSVQPLTN